MSTKENYRSAVRTTITLMVMAVFLLIPLIQAFHHHPHTQAAHIKPSKEQVGTEKSCLTCQYFAHVKGKQFHPVIAQTSSPILGSILERKDRFNGSIYPAALTAFTNKGPPFKPQQHR